MAAMEEVGGLRKERERSVKDFIVFIDFENLS